MRGHAMLRLAEELALLGETASRQWTAYRSTLATLPEADGEEACGVQAEAATALVDSMLAGSWAAVITTRPARCGSSNALLALAAAGGTPPPASVGRVVTAAGGAAPLSTGESTPSDTGGASTGPSSSSSSSSTFGGHAPPPPAASPAGFGASGTPASCPAAAAAAGSGAGGDAYAVLAPGETVRNVEFACMLLDSELSEPALVSLCVEILTERGCLPVGEIGKLLQEATANGGLPSLLKERYGGLKVRLSELLLRLRSTS